MGVERGQIGPKRSTKEDCSRPRGPTHRRRVNKRRENQKNGSDICGRCTSRLRFRVGWKKNRLLNEAELPGRLVFVLCPLKLPELPAVLPDDDLPEHGRMTFARTAELRLLHTRPHGRAPRTQSSPRRTGRTGTFVPRDVRSESTISEHKASQGSSRTKVTQHCKKNRLQVKHN